MIKYIPLLLSLLIIGCFNQEEGNRGFSKDQITALHLNSTKVLITETDSTIGIDLNPLLTNKKFDFGSKVKEIKIIPLETVNESLLTRIKNIIVTDSNIYVHDDFNGGGIVIFDNEGKFKKRIQSGKGPGEIYQLYDISFDKQNNELVAYQHPFLSYFSPSGKFIRQKRLPLGFYNFAVTPTGYIFKTLDRQGNKHLEDLKDFSLLVTDKDFKLTSAGMYCLPNKINLGGPRNLHENIEMYITQRFNDTIYQYCKNNNLIRAKYYLNYSKKRLPERFILGSKEDFDNAIKQNDYYFNLGKYLDNGSHHIFFLDNWHKRLQTIIYRDKETGNMICGTDADYNQDEMPPIAFPRWTSGEYFISTYYPNGKEAFITKSSIISDEDKVKAKRMTEDDNPVLVFFKLKNF